MIFELKSNPLALFTITCYNTGMTRICLLVALFFSTSVVFAQRALVPVVEKSLLPAQWINPTLEQTISRQLARQVTRTPSLSALAKQDRGLYFQHIGVEPLQNMATLSVNPARFEHLKDKIFAFKNDKNAFPWLALTEKDLTFLSTHKAQIRRSIRVQTPHTLDLVSFIAPQVRNIAVGEEHNVLAIRQAVEQLVFDYQKEYPERKIIVLTEFVSDRLFAWENPGEPVSAFGLKHRIVNDDFLFLANFIRNGIEVIGLEDIVYFSGHQTLIAPSFRQVDSVYGMKQRNEHWRRIIEDVRRREPDAIFFIYTGNMHVHSRAPFTLTNPSTQTMVLQLVQHDLGTDLPFGFVMKDEPFATAKQTPTVLSWSKQSIFRVRSGFDVGVIFPKE